ncbi:MAG: hypothetical protein ACLVIY_11030 [Anaerobutyricum soehngenii]
MMKFISFALIAAMAVNNLVGWGNKEVRQNGGSLRRKANHCNVKRRRLLEQEELSSNCLVSGRRRKRRKSR